MSNSQFASLFPADTKEKTKPKTATKREKKKTDTSTSLSPAGKTPPQIVTRTRITGKSSNPDYTQVLTYIRKDTHNAARAALIFEEQKRDLSDLVEELLAAWIKNNSR